jgi:hypothetical protein
MSPIVSDEIDETRFSPVHCKPVTVTDGIAGMALKPPENKFFKFVIVKPEVADMTPRPMATK